MLTMGDGFTIMTGCHMTTCHYSEGTGGEGKDANANIL